jgi:hypothetical protein
VSESIAGILGFIKLDPAVMPEVWGFTVRMVLFCIPFLLIGIYLERNVDGRVLIAGWPRMLKMFLLIVSVAPLGIIGAVNLLNAVRPGLMAGVLAEHPALENLMVMDGMTGPLLLLGLLLVFTLLYAAEIATGDTSR